MLLAAWAIANCAESVRAVAAVSDDCQKGGGSAYSLLQTNASIEEIRAPGTGGVHLGRQFRRPRESSAGVEEVAAEPVPQRRIPLKGWRLQPARPESARTAGARMDAVAWEIHSAGEKTKESMGKIRTLADSVEKISGFVTVITAIADQDEPPRPERRH
ncbi:hypothetical protein MASR2M17_24580 [Aminivibrio sp.]